MIFRCDASSSVGKIKVKDRGDGKYHVLSTQKGFNGIVYADNEVKAAKSVCSSLRN